MQRRTLLLVAVTAALAACTTPAPDSSPSPTGPAGSPTSTQSPTTRPSPTPAPVVEIEVGPDRSLSMPTALAAGATVFQVSAEAPTEVTVLQPDEGYTKEHLAEDFGPQTSEGAATAAWVRFDAETRSLGGTWAAPDRRHGFALVLEPGTYWFVDLYREPGEAGDDDVLDPDAVLTVEVTGSGATGELPEPDGEAVARDDRSWDLPTTIPARGTLLVRNPTEAGHRLVLDPVPDDQDPEAWLELSRKGRGLECVCNSPVRVSAGEEFLWLHDLEPRHYLAMDFSLTEGGALNANGAGAALVEAVGDQQGLAQRP